VISLLAATLVGATAVASVLAATPYVRRPRRAPPLPPSPPGHRTLHDELLAELARPVSRPAACRSRRASFRRTRGALLR